MSFIAKAIPTTIEVEEDIPAPRGTSPPKTTSNVGNL